MDTDLEPVGEIAQAGDEGLQGFLVRSFEGRIGIGAGS